MAATETTNTCGPGALGASERFEFEIDLSRAHSELFWDGRVAGDIDASLEFEFAASVRISVSEPRGARTGCAVARQDRIGGVLVEDGAGAVTGFSGAMLYDFAADLACTEEELMLSGLARLPCAMHYDLSAERSRAPQP